MEILAARLVACMKDDTEDTGKRFWRCCCIHSCWALPDEDSNASLLSIDCLDGNWKGHQSEGTTILDGDWKGR